MIDLVNTKKVERRWCQRENLQLSKSAALVKLLKLPSQILVPAYVLRVKAERVTQNITSILVAYFSLKLTNLNTERPKISADFRTYKGRNIGFGELSFESQLDSERRSLTNGILLTLIQDCEKSEFIQERFHRFTITLHVVDSNQFGFLSIHDVHQDLSNLNLIAASVCSSRIRCSCSSARTSRNITSEVDKVWVLEGSNTRGGSRDNCEVDALVGISSICGCSS